MPLCTFASLVAFLSPAKPLPRFDIDTLYIEKRIISFIQGQLLSDKTAKSAASCG